jgi:3'(2'), 5'-bisphosphate nucleotidase
MLKDVQQIAMNAGHEILRFYSFAEAVNQKTDGSPITNADRAAHRLIVGALTALTPDLPIVSEESSQKSHADCRRWKSYWLVDPLDGTKEFVKRTNEFTVNICLISNREPVLGVVHAPALQLSYLAEQGAGAWKQTQDQPPIRIKTRRADPGQLCVVVSRDHVGPGEANLLRQFPNAKVTGMGSSLKFCLVAEGLADLYPRLGPTMEWDTGAAQCVVEEAGGVVQDTQGARLVYQKPELRNPALLTLGDSLGFNFRQPQ